MASTVTRDHHNLRRNLNLNGKYISNDGGDEGITISDAGIVTVSSDLDIALNMTIQDNKIEVDSGSLQLDVDDNLNIVASAGNVTFKNALIPGIDMGLNIASLNYISLYDIADDDNYLSIQCAADGASKIKTNDESGVAAHLTLAIDGDLYADVYNHLYVQQTGTTQIDLNPVGAGGGGGSIKLMSLADTGDYFDISIAALGATTITTVDDGDSGDGVSADLTLNIDGKIDINGAAGEDITIDAGGDIILKQNGEYIYFHSDHGEFGYIGSASNSQFKLYQNGGSGGSPSSNYLGITVATAGTSQISTASAAGGIAHLRFTVDGHVEFDGCAVGFDKETTTFAASAVIEEGDDSTDIDFRLGNKHELTLTDDIAGSGSGEYINMIFPATSGNFILVLIQGVADCTVHSSGWRAYQSDGSTLGINTLALNAVDGKIRWAGGTAPTLSTSQYDVDVVSFYWDADNGTALGVASLDFG